MQCPKCKGTQLRCNDSRYKDGTVYRRRTCQECGNKFTTMEVTLETFNAMKDPLDKLRKIRAAVLNLIDE